MASIGKYGQINAKIRAMRSNLLDKNVLQKLIDTNDFKEFISSLSNTKFAAFIDKQNTDPVSVEYSITLENVSEWKHLRKDCTAELDTVVDFFIEEYELRKLKHILRLWHRNKHPDTSFLNESIRYEYSVADIFQSDNIHSFIDRLSDTPYDSILLHNVSQYEQMDSVFPYEISLDKDYYNRLWNLTEFFGKKDREISRKMLGIEIDLLNLDWISRFRDFYNVSASSLSKYLITKGNDDEKSFMQSIDKAQSAPKILEEIIGKHRVKQLSHLDYNNKIAFFEKALYTVLLSEARKAFTGFPFTISILWGYRVFLKFEAKNLFSIIQSKVYQLNKDEVLEYLVF